ISVARAGYELRVEIDHVPSGRMELKGEIAKRQRQPETARLDVGLLQRPVIEERAVLLVLRQLAQIGDFIRREETAGDVVRQLAIDVLDVDADLAADRH